MEAGIRITLELGQLWNQDNPGIRNQDALTSKPQSLPPKNCSLAQFPEQSVWPATGCFFS
jgi:hypothetical protein